MEVGHLGEHLLDLHLENTCCLYLKVWMQSNMNYSATLF